MQDQLTSTKRRRPRALLWLAIASLAAVAMLGSTGASALGAGHGTDLHQAPPISFDDPEFQGDEEECEGTPGNWHFVLVQTSAASGTLTATFEGGVFVVGSTKKTGGTLHFDVPAGDDTLLGATTDAVGRLLLLSHICGGTTTTTSSSTSTITTSGSATN